LFVVIVMSRALGGAVRQASAAESGARADRAVLPQQVRLADEISTRPCSVSAID
jgi:hypothetical protein